jgi:hypothetical protein
MGKRAWSRTRFDSDDHEPMSAMSNLVDIMLVFACGLIAAYASGQLTADRSGAQTVQHGREVPEIPHRIGEAGSGFQPVGRVYRDPDTGKLILIGNPE